MTSRSHQLQTRLRRSMRSVQVLSLSRKVRYPSLRSCTDAKSVPDAAGGQGRHLGIFTCTLLMYVLCISTYPLLLTIRSVGRIVGTGIFSTPSSILGSVGSVGASLMLWVGGFILSFAGLFMYLEYGTMFPRSGGDKVYLEAVYKRPKYLATIVFAVNAIVFGFSASGCIVRYSVDFHHHVCS